MTYGKLETMREVVVCWCKFSHDNSKTTHGEYKSYQAFSSTVIYSTCSCCAKMCPALLLTLRRYETMPHTTISSTHAETPQQTSLIVVLPS